MSSLNAIIAAIVRVLRNDKVLKSKVSGVLDFVPDGQPFPYISIGEGTETNFHTFDKSGRDITINLNIFSQHEGFFEAQDILERINELLDYKDIMVDGNHLVYIRYEDGQRIREADGVTRSIVGRYRVVVQGK